MLIEAHPQRAEVIQLLTDPAHKLSLRKIQEKLNPPVCLATLSRFRLKLLGTAAKGMRGKEANVRAIKDLVALSSDQAAMEKLKQRVRNDLQAALKKSNARRAGWLNDAEEVPLIEPDTGLPIRDKDGKIVRRMNHTALAAHDRNTLNSMEFEAKLHGLLVEDNPRDVTIQAVVMMPQAQQQAPQRQVEQGDILEADVISR